MTFPHPSAASRAASGCMLLTRCLPRIFDGLAVMPAILGSFYWLGFETPELSSGKKRLALLGAQRLGHPRRGGKLEFKEGRYPPLDEPACCVSVWGSLLIELRVSRNEHASTPVIVIESRRVL